MAAAWILVVVICACFAAWLPIPSPTTFGYGPPASGPSLHDWFGTNTGGQDIFSQVVHGARISIVVAVVAVAAGVLVGGAAGVAAGYLGGRTEAVVVWVSDVLLTFPMLVLALAVVAFVGSSDTDVVAAIAVLGLPAYARIIRGVTLSVARQDYVLASEALGASRWTTLRREVVPNVAVPMLAYAAVGASIAVVVQGGLAFLGVGNGSSYAWGYLISQGQQQMADAPQMLLAPVFVLFCTILSLYVLGDRLGASLDPRQGKL